ncbi:MAG TPA: antitoxin Xre/MbcA/ParS toxin-binding domain-containing protein [Tepidisphaeraceae bacterium]|jgi:putative toxin-antitoxin system antitoxin component (TIGR02293 family)|nr:antitoxin Xre/MbcA/ParS toxin-binding domain-containing protein [Tepidisphaeraceae bacterium]
MTKMKLVRSGAKRPRVMPKSHDSGRKSLVRGMTATASPRLLSGGVELMDYRQPGDSIGAKYSTDLEAVKLIESGLPFSAILRFHRVSGLTLERIKNLAGFSEGSFARRKQSGRLSSQESERMLRIGRIFERATSLYRGDQIGALQWLATPIPALGDQPPLDLARTEPGAREVEDLIGRIEHGVVS